MNAMMQTEPIETVNLVPTETAPVETEAAGEVVTPEVVPEVAEPPKDGDAERALRAMQRRIDKRTADMYRERAEKEHLQQRIAALESRDEAAPEQQTADPIALAREIAAVERVTEKSNGIAKDGEKRYGAEWAPALQAVADEVGALFDRRGRPTPVGEAILDSDDPAGLLHHLSKNLDTAADLHGLSAAQLGRRIGLIEAQMATASKPPVSAAPKPLVPVKGTDGGAKDPSDMTDAEFAAWRRRAIAQRR